MSLERVNRVRVRTPEGVVFTFPLAGPMSRFLGWLIDWLIILAAMTVARTVLVFVFVVSADWANAILVLFYFAVTTGYRIGFEWKWRGQTLGKKLMRLRVVDEGGLSLTFSQVLLRNLLRAFDALPVAYLVGGAAMMLNARSQRLGDLAAGTIVVRHGRVREPDFGQLFRGKFNSLREHPHLAARLRQQVPPPLAAAAVGALLRREELEPAARVALFAELADGFRRIVPYPADVTSGMPDETYVRNVVEIVHGNAGPTPVSASAAFANHSDEGAISART